MGTLREKIKRALPWVDPVIEYFDWRKRIFTALAGICWGAWSFMSGLAWPVIAFLVFGALVLTAYALVFPAFIRLVNVGVKAHPNHNIWKHKTQFKLYEAACLLADADPTSYSKMDGDSRAWYSGLREAIILNEIKYSDNKHTQHTGMDGRYIPDEYYTVITAESLKSFCEARKRRPEFLMWE